jgi:hypothetical protein
MLDWFITNFWAFVIPIELALLFIFYKYYLAELNASRWLAKAEEENFLEGLLRPILDLIVEETTDSIVHTMKMELLAGQGQVSRMALSDIETPEDMAMKVSGELIKSTGIKNVPPMVQYKMAQGIGSLANKFMDKSTQEAATSTVKRGSELLRGNNF